jgi:hypothetical protein
MFLIVFNAGVIGANNLLGERGCSKARYFGTGASYMYIPAVFRFL